MLEKFLSVLPYNPSLVHQLAFYSKRMRQEQSIRRTGLIFLALAFLIQFLAVLNPPQPTVAYSTNDMINGGFSTKSEAVNACKTNLKSYGNVLWNFGISCADVANGGTVSLNSTAYNKELYSMGWLSYGQKNPRTGKSTGEVPLNLTKVDSTLYARFLWSFDTYDHSTYQALKVTSSVTHKVYFILYSCGNLVSIGTPAPIPPCKYDSSLLSNDTRCVQPCQYNKSLSASSPQCYAPCPIVGKQNLPQTSPQCYNPCPYNKSIAANSPKCFQACQYNKSIPVTSPQCYPPCQYNPLIPAGSTECKSCDKSVSSQDILACVTTGKKAANQTQNISDANGTTAHARDIIVYTLYATNNGKATVRQFIFQENISDVLDYATVTDWHGGQIDSDNMVKWPAVDIQPGTTASVQLTVKVKDPIPDTPPAPSDPAHFDHIMTNTYSNTVNINLPGSPITTVITTSANLPNTGPGTSLAVAAVTVMLAGYFYARSRLLATEARLAIQDSIAGGV